MLEAIDMLDDLLSVGGEVPLVTVRAVERCFEIVSEASLSISPGLKATEPEIPWREVAGIGNILRHDYPGVDIRLLVATHERDIPPLKAALLRMQARIAE